MPQEIIKNRKKICSLQNIRIMNLLDKISVLEANSVTTREFENATGMTRDEYLKEMRRFVEEQRAKEPAADLKK